MEIPKNRLKELREEKNVTLREIKEATGIDNGNLSKMERGERDISGNNLILLVEFFNVSADYLLGISKYRFNVEQVKFDNETVHIASTVKELSKEQKETVLQIVKQFKKN